MTSLTKKLVAAIKKCIIFIGNTIKSIFINGFLSILPLALTIALFSFTWKVLQNWVEPLHKIKPEFLESIPYAEVIIVLLFIFIIGTILKLFVLKSLINIFEALLDKIPLVRNVYRGFKQLIHAFSVQDKVSFQQVVLIEFPREGIYSIGFLTSQIPPELAPNQQEEFCHVYVPTAPNPTTGFLIIAPRASVKELNLTRQEAMALIISVGIIKPDRLLKKKKK